MICTTQVEHKAVFGTADPAVLAVGRLLAEGRPLPALEQAELLLAAGHGDRAVLVESVQLSVQAICCELARFDADRDERFAGHDAAWFMARQTEIEVAYPCPALPRQSQSDFNIPSGAPSGGREETAAA